jgi:single-strand DNA-binding protein
MANGLNHCTFCGNLGSDPELRVTQSDHSILKFSIACSEPIKKPDGSWGEHTEWVPVVVWGKRAEGLAKFLAKGHTVIVTGKMRTTSYEDRDGNRRFRTEISADDIVVPSNRGGGGRARDEDAEQGGGQRRATRRPQNEQGQQGQQERGGYDDADYGSREDDDIPF